MSKRVNNTSAISTKIGFQGKLWILVKNGKNLKFFFEIRGFHFSGRCLYTIETGPVLLRPCCLQVPYNRTSLAIVMAWNAGRVQAIITPVHHHQREEVLTTCQPCQAGVNIHLTTAATDDRLVSADLHTCITYPIYRF